MEIKIDENCSFHNVVNSTLEEKANEDNSNHGRRVDNLNSANCEVCGSKGHVKLFKQVVGDANGFKTIEVLSCRNCKNERKIEPYRYISKDDIFWGDMFFFYFGIMQNNKKYLDSIESIYLNNPISTRKLMKELHNNFQYFYNDLKNWSPEKWAKAGFKIDKVRVVTKFLFWEKESFEYPTWEELEKKIN